jgi:hypothetical protein
MNNPNNPNNQYNKMPLHLSEALEYKDMDGMMKPTIHVDEFASKMGDDDEIIVLSFFVRSKQAATDLSNWFEKGYDFVMDSDTSPGEISPGRFLVYVEIKRRTKAGAQAAELIDDLGTLTEFDSRDWTMVYEGKDYAFSREEFDRLVPLSPKQYRAQKEQDLNEMRVASGLAPKRIYEIDDPRIKAMQMAAGL